MLLQCADWMPPSFSEAVIFAYLPTSGLTSSARQGTLGQSGLPDNAAGCLQRRKERVQGCFTETQQALRRHSAGTFCAWKLHELEFRNALSCSHMAVPE